MQQKFDTIGLSPEFVLLAVFKLKYKPSAALSNQRIENALTLENAEVVYNNAECNKNGYFSSCKIGDLPQVELNARITDKHLILFQTHIDVSVMTNILANFSEQQSSNGFSKS